MSGIGTVESSGALSQLFDDALVWLRDNYRSYHFFAERDIVWTLQTHMIREAQSRTQGLKIYDNHKLVKGKQADLVIISNDNSADTVAEIKYEPDHARLDITPGKLNPSKVFWKSKRYGGVEPDIVRVRDYVAQGLARTAMAVFIDEGSHFRSKRTAPEGSKWIDWGKSPYSEATVSVMIARFPSL